MKKKIAYIISMMLLSSCTSWHSDCSNFSDIKVKRVYDDGVVASTCKDSFWTTGTYCKNEQEVFLIKDTSKAYYDGQDIEIPYGTCPIVIGSKNKSGTTYPLITIQNPNIYSIPETKNLTEPTLPKNITNPKCQPFKKIKIFQVLDDFSLANTCDDDDHCWGLVVYVPKEKGKIYYDEQKISPSKNQCFGFNETYQYKTEDERTKTVPKISFINATIPNPKYNKNGK